MSDFRRSNRMIRNSLLVAATALFAFWGFVVRPMKATKERIEHDGLLTPQDIERNAKLERKVELRKATERGDWQRIESLLQQGVGIDADIGDVTALITAARYGKTEIIRKLLAAGAKIDAKDQFGNTALLYAARYGQNDALKTLLEHGAKLDAQNINQLNAVDLAIIGQHRQTYELLKSRRLKINPVQALKLNDLKHLRELVSTGVDLNGFYVSGDPKAAGEDKSGLIRTRTGTSIGIIAFIGWTPLYETLHRKQWETAEYLLKNGAKVDAVNQSGGTALMYCVGSQNKEGIEFLLQHGANINHQRKGGYTALMDAATTGNADMIEFLLSHSARIDLKLDDGKTIFDIKSYSTPEKQAEVNRILREAQAKSRDTTKK